MTIETNSGLNVLRDSFEGLQLPDSIIVTSASAIKVGTVKKVLLELFPKRNFNVVGVKAQSGINEQPVGDEAEQGARNRIQSAEGLVGTEAKGPHAFVSVESGIFDDGNGGWEDKAVAAIKLPNGRVCVSVSPRGVQFPTEAVEAARAKDGGFKENTVGSVIAEMYAARGIKIDKQDPQSALTNGEFPREQQMMSAIKGALSEAAKS
ncbi:MAG: DUF84 family protein [bacterium]|nr:DUF84 family protein [bacterium]